MQRKNVHWRLWITRGVILRPRWNKSWTNWKSVVFVRKSVALLWYSVLVSLLVALDITFQFVCHYYKCFIKRNVVINICHIIFQDNWYCMSEKPIRNIKNLSTFMGTGKQNQIPTTQHSTKRKKQLHTKKQRVLFFLVVDN